MAAITQKKLWRGLPLKRLNKLRAAIRMLVDQDQRMQENARPGQTVYFFSEEPQDEVDLALLTLINRIATCKAELRT